MKSFNFRLKQFHKIKEFEEKMALNEVLKQEARVAQIETQIQNLKQSQKNGRYQMSLAGHETQSPSLDLYNESISGLQRKIELLSVELDQENKILEKLKVKYFESKKELKTLDKLKEKKKDEFKIKASKQDEKRTTEIAGQFFSRGKTQDE